MGGDGAGAWIFFFVFSGVGIDSSIIYFHCIMKSK